MDIKIFCPLWGHEQMDIALFCRKIKEAGYDGIDTWMPADNAVRKQLMDALKKESLLLVAHQHEAAGTDFTAFKTSFKQYLESCAAAQPLLINSHSGRDYFTLQQNLELIDIAAAFAEEKGIAVLHETHRGRIGFSPFVMRDYFRERPAIEITADFSHWTCVTESLLENFQEELSLAIAATRHVHARVGFEEGPQVPDPRAPEWQYAVNRFIEWWDAVVQSRRQAGATVLGFTTEFGPPPYMPTLPFSKEPVADQFAINCYMKDLLRQRYGS